MAKDLEAVPSSTSAPDHTPERGPDVELAQATTAAAAAAVALGGRETPVEAPAAGEIVVVPARPGDTFVVAFDPAAAKITLEDGDLVLSFADGGRIVFAGFAAAAEADQPPALILPDGTVLAGNVVVVVALAAAEALDLATAAAAGPEILGGGFNVYGENLGDVIDLLTPLGVLPPTALQFPAFEPPEDAALLVPAGEEPPEGPEEEPEPEEEPPEIFNLTPSVDGGEATVDEENLPDGTNPDPSALTQTGTFNISAPDGFDDLTIGGVLVVTDGVVTLPGSPIMTTYGELTITGVDLGTGVVSYSFELTGNTPDHGPGDNGENDVFDNVVVILTDTDGDSANSILSIQVVDDVPKASPESDPVEPVADPTGVSASGNVLTNDLFGADGKGDPAITQIVHDGITYTFDGTTVTSAGLTEGIDFFFEDGDLRFTTELGATFKIGLVDDAVGLDLGDYTYFRPGAATPEDAELFEYTIKDGDGDTASATLSIFLEERNITQANLQTQSSAQDIQTILVTVTEQFDGRNDISGELAFLPGTAKEENTLTFNDSLVFDADNTYTITVEYVSGGNSINITGLILTDKGVPIFTVNPFDNDNDLDFRIGVQSNDYDGGIYILEGDGTDHTVVPPVGYDFDGTTLQLETIAPGNNDFDLNLSDLVVNTFADPDGNPATDDGVATIDISGNFTGGQPNNEDNTLTLTANDVLDMNSPSETLTILGGPDDVVNLVDQDGAGGDAWTVATDTPTGFDTWTFGTTIATVIVDDDVTVNVIV